MKKTIIRIATRKSPLAIWQAEFVKRKLDKLHSNLSIEIIGMLTEGDKLWATPLVDFGGKGLFIKELENALLENRADIAVHSMKDVPAELPPGLVLNVVCERTDPRDVFVSIKYQNLEELPPATNVGTSSLRRICQLKALRPDIEIRNLRGNVGTRLQRLKTDGYFDAIILAAAGLERLQITDYAREYFDPENFVPAIGQGAIGIECRAADEAIRELIAPLNDVATQTCVVAERAMNAQFGGNCKTPIAAYATLQQQKLRIQGLVGKIDGSLILKSFKIGAAKDAEKLGIAVAEDLFAQGAEEILKGF